MLQVAPKKKRALTLYHSGWGGALTQRILWRMILAGCSPQLGGGQLLNLPLPREIGSGSTAASDLLVPTYTAKESVGAPGNPYAHYIALAMVWVVSGAQLGALVSSLLQLLLKSIHY